MAMVSGVDPVWSQLQALAQIRVPFTMVWYCVGVLQICHLEIWVDFTGCKTVNPSSLEAETGRSQVQDQTETVSKNQHT